MSNNVIHEQAVAFSKVVCKHPAYVKAWNAIEQLERYRGIKPKLILVQGSTGAGKTFVSEQVRATRPPVISDTISILPVAYVDVSLASTIGSVLTSLLSQLGAPTPNSGTIAKRMLEVSTLMKTMKVELIILDEIQDWIPKSGVTPKSEVYLFFKSCLNQWKIPFLILGTEDSQDIFIDEQLKDRCLPFQTLPIFNCVGAKGILNFGALIESMLSKFPRKVKGMNFVKKSTNEKGKPELSLVKKNRGLLLRLCLATKGKLRLTSDLLTECIYQTQEDEVVDMEVLETAYNYSINGIEHANPFDEYTSMRTVIKQLKKRGLYEK
ncbi:TniB family NTP-binding protein [Colwellia polaris]|jgi:hypothetical protein|uniref:TniB family NTP-binding protein n=1 Tax=Colwellia polaris TaxID=326537 RepID=UPI000A175980|nr:TniB family NTP-binding protein [Colwellia polaris]|tara:strand:- start:731 stop:1699 length:969 start_codon:yes stop_codon:yes gene_type:complete